MKKNKAGIITVSIIVALLAIVVLGDYLMDRMKEPPTYDHGDIKSITWEITGGVDGRHIEYSAYEDGDGYKFSYTDKRTPKKVFEITEKDFELLTEKDYNDILWAQKTDSIWKGSQGSDQIHNHMIFTFADGTTTKVESADMRITSFFEGCEDAFLNEDQ